jgi:hypothetical protein
MKKLILTAILSVAAVGAFAQGTVTFLNDTGTLTSPPDRFIRFGTNAAAFLGVAPNSLAFGTNLQVQLYYGASTASDASLVAVTSAPARLRAQTSAGVGTWSSGGARTLGTFDYGSGAVKLQVRVWDITTGATYETSNGGIRGSSQSFLYTIPATAGDPPGNFIMSNFTGLNGAFAIDIVPEPSTFALAGLGAAALVIFRRRK